MNTDAVADRASRYKDCAMCLGNTKQPKMLISRDAQI